MEALKKYWPYLLIAAVGLYLLSRYSSQRTALVPQTQFMETPQTDPFAESRAGAFRGLLELTGLQIGAEAETERARLASMLAARGQEAQYRLGFRALDTELARTDIIANTSARAAELNFLQRENDRQIQQSAIDRYNSSQRTNAIIGSVGQALGGIFGRLGNRGIFTPPTFPTGGGFSFF